MTAASNFVLFDHDFKKDAETPRYARVAYLFLGRDGLDKWKVRLKVIAY